MSLISKRKDSVAVVGVGTTDYGALVGHDATSLGIWALRNAAEDAGIDLQDIDGLICQRLTDYQKFVQITNTSPKLVTALPGAGRMTGGTIQMAVQAILSGMLDTVAVVYGNDGHTAGARYGGKGDTYGTGAEEMWFPYGMTSPGAVHSMLFQRHAHMYRDQGRAAWRDRHGVPQARRAQPRGRHEEAGDDGRLSGVQVHL